jgi:hypothetical protein
MSRPEPTPERLDELLAGAPPSDDTERESAALINEIRGLRDEPSPELRARVEEIASASPAHGRRGWRERLALPGLPALTGPRLAIAGGAAALLVVAAIAVPLASDGDDSATLATADGVEQVEPTEREQIAPGADVESDDIGPAPGGPLEEAFRSGGSASAGPVSSEAIPPGPDQGRPQEVRVQTAVQVAGVEGLSKAASRAMARVRELGGFTVSSRFSVPSSEIGTADLILRVPSTRVEEALEGFAELGSVISQEATLTDLGQELSRRQMQITRQRERLAALRAELRESPDDEDLKRQIAAAERRLASLVEQRKQVLERARLATLQLRLTTEGPAAVDEDENRFLAAFERSWEKLATVLEWAISAAVFLVPLGLLGWLGLALARNLRRREARRLMDAV